MQIRIGQVLQTLLRCFYMAEHNYGENYQMVTWKKGFQYFFIVKYLIGKYLPLTNANSILIWHNYWNMT